MKITIDTVKSSQPSDWSLLSDTYTSLQGELKFKCPEGHEFISSWGKVRDKFNCPICKKNSVFSAPIIKPKPKNKVRTLAIDQATLISGFAIFDGEDLVHYGTFEVNDSKEIIRIHKIKEWLISMVENWKPDFIVLEDIIYDQMKGVITYRTLARLQGVLSECCYDLNIDFEIVPAATWREYCKVKGKKRQDKKKSMQLIAHDKYNVNVSEDIADAIGIGLYGSSHYKKQTEIIQWV